MLSMNSICFIFMISGFLYGLKIVSNFSLRKYIIRADFLLLAEEANIIQYFLNCLTLLKLGVLK